MLLPKLTPRLQRAADLVPESESLIDIGTDHGYLPLYLVLTGRVSQAVAADIRKGPLQNAKENVSLYNATVDTVLSDGFKQISQKYCCGCICGMGGETICEIISAAGNVLPDTLILQAMTGIQKLRAFLWDNGFLIDAESFVSENEKTYCVIRAVYDGQKREYSYEDTFLGKLRPEDEEFSRWKKKCLSAAQKRLLGACTPEELRLIEICKN